MEKIQENRIAASEAEIEEVKKAAVEAVESMTPEQVLGKIRDLLVAPESFTLEEAAMIRQMAVNGIEKGEGDIQEALILAAVKRYEARKGVPGSVYAIVDKGGVVRAVAPSGQEIKKIKSEGEEIAGEF
jgi:hypothetical protein